MLQASRGQHYAELISLARLPSHFPDRSLDVEIRVNRKTSKLQVYLNGEPDGEWRLNRAKKLAAAND